MRHGLTVENAAGIYHGRSDGTLTIEQRIGLQRTAFDASHYDVVHCSPLGRCRDTARALGVERFVIESRLTERDFGLFEGLSRAECEQRYPKEYREFLRFDGHYVPPGGESRAHHFERVRAWLQEACVHRHVLAITHGGTIDFLYRLARELNLHGGDDIYSASNASLSSFEVQWPRVTLVAYDVPLVGSQSPDP